jgi:hypothetical protein
MPRAARSRARRPGLIHSGQYLSCEAVQHSANSGLFFAGVYRVASKKLRMAHANAVGLSSIT